MCGGLIRSIPGKAEATKHTTTHVGLSVSHFTLIWAAIVGVVDR